jgi:hypothetical protein
LGAGATLGLLAGCSTLRPPAAALADASPAERWARVLRDRVDDAGRADFTGLARDPGPLDAYVAHVAEMPSDSMPDRNARLAYLVNSYNALSMWSVLQRGIPERLDLLRRVRFFKLTRATVGGRAISLYDYENDVIRPLGEERVHFALNCMAVSCPRCRASPSPPPGWAASWARRSGCSSRSRASSSCTARGGPCAFPPSWTSTRRTSWKAPTLVAYVNRTRTPPVPADHRTEFLDYDWTTNRQPGGGSRA